MEPTTLTTDQQQRAEALERVTRALRGGGSLLASAATLPAEAWTYVSMLAEWVVVGPDADSTDVPDATPTTYKCPLCEDDHDLDDAVVALVAIARDDIGRVVARLRGIGLDPDADALEQLVESDRFRSAMRDAFLASNAAGAAALDDLITRTVRDVLNNVTDR